MQRSQIVFAAICLCLITAHVISDVTTDKNFLNKQKTIFQLFWHPNQPSTVCPELYQLARSWNFEEHISSFTNETVVHDFIQHFKHGMLNRNAVFSVFYPQHLNDVMALFKVLYYAKDFDTFVNVAAWGRANINPAVFSYALAVAVIHRSDTRYLRIPPLYELTPHLHYNNEVLQAAYYAKMGDASLKKSLAVKYRQGSDIIIHANYSGWYISHAHEHPEEKLNYFTEDIGLTSTYFHLSHEYPFWMRSHDYNLQMNVRGEVYYYYLKQFLSRYYVERLSNDLGDIELIDWHEPIMTGYYPTMNHPNGLPFPHRHSHSKIPDFKYNMVHDLEEVHSRICSAIDSGYVYDDNHPPKLVDLYSSEGFNILGNLIQGNADSINPNYYHSFEHLCRKIFGFSGEPIDKNHIFPSALEFYSTSFRDPIYFRISKRILSYFLRYKERLPKYTYDELMFPGVKIESIDVDKLVTFFEHFDAVLSNGIPVSSHKDAETSVIKVRQHRLNYKPFTYRMVINSDKNVQAMIRVFLGPTHDEHGYKVDLANNFMNFYEIDQWIVNLDVGVNAIERSSYKSVYVVQDEESPFYTWKKLIKAIENDETYEYKSQLYGVPERLLLPKGKPEGLPMQFFIYISGFDNVHSMNISSPIWGTHLVDGKSLGYPLDRPVMPYAFHVPNAYFKDVMIFHKQADELNLTS